MNGSLLTAASSDLAVTQMEVYGSGRGLPGGKASLFMALRRFLRSFDLGSTLGGDLGTKVDVYESVDLPLGGGISWLNFTNAARLAAAAEGAADFVSRSSSACLTASRTASIWTLSPSFPRAADKASIRTTPKEGGFEIVGDIAQAIAMVEDVTVGESHVATPTQCRKSAICAETPWERLIENQSV